MRKTVIVGIAVSLVLADTTLWLCGTWLLSSRSAQWARQAQAHGWTVSWEQQAWGGWPFAASLMLDRAAISGGARYLPGGLAWSADRVVASVSLFHPLTLCVAADGQQFLRVAHAPDLGFVAGTAAARLPLGWSHHGRGALHLADVSGGIAGSGHPQDVQLGAVSVALEARQDDAHLTARLVIEARNVGLPDIGRWPLGATIAGAGATILLNSPLSERGRQELDAQGALQGGALQAAAWRDGGGTVAVQDATLHWGPLAARASAKLALDETLQPSGSGTAEVLGTAPALDAASQAGLVAPGLALTAEAVLSVMTHVHNPDGDAVRLPFLLHDRTISVGEIPVARLPSIRW